MGTVILRSAWTIIVFVLCINCAQPADVGVGYYFKQFPNPTSPYESHNVMHHPLHSEKITFGNPLPPPPPPEPTQLGHLIPITSHSEILWDEENPFNRDEKKVQDEKSLKEAISDNFKDGKRNSLWSDTVYPYISREVSSAKGKGRDPSSRLKDFHPYYTDDDNYDHDVFDEDEDDFSTNRNRNNRNRDSQSDRVSLALRYLDLFVIKGDRDSIPDYGNLLNKYERNLSQISEVCPSNSCYAGYNANARRAINNVGSLYNGRAAGNLEDLMHMAQFLRAREEIHPQVWYVSMMRAQLARMPFSLSMERPHPMYLFPTRFFPESILQHTNLTTQDCVLLDERIGADNGIENRLWYWREDVLLNAQHWVWHLLYPVNTTSPIDRRGESFYFFHHEMVARYLTERNGNGLKPPIPLNMNLNSVIEESYNPHLVDGISTMAWAPRPPMQQLSAVLNDTVFYQLYNFTVTRDRVLDTIFTGSIHRGNRSVAIHTTDNINTLGELAEASSQSSDPEFYGTSGFHNQGHLILSNVIGDAPAGTQGVMGDETTAMRDPIFYRFHRLVDILFQTYKSTHLTPYELHEGDHPLVFDGVSVTDIKVLPDSGGTPNYLRTFWNARRVTIEGGLDFNVKNRTEPPTVQVCTKHLDHEEFTYKIRVSNHHDEETLATVRIFLAPRYKSPKDQIRYPIVQQRSLFFTLDSFMTYLKPGSNTIMRRSEDSTLTAGWPKSIQQLRLDVMNNVTERAHCECGFPHHLLLPKGTPKGMVFDLFVMITDGAVDQVTDFGSTAQQRMERKYPHMPQCTPSHVHCGIQGRRYPDSKPMGYPFDRRLPHSLPTEVGGRKNAKQIEMLEDYVSHVPNMGTTKIVIAHKNVQIGLSDMYVNM